MIPARAHFIWFGPRLPWANALSIHSAAQRGGFDELILHHDTDLSSTPEWPALAALPGFRARRLDAASLDALFAALGSEGEALGRIYARLEAPAARANVLRVALLLHEGGVYLDLDTITVRSFDDLRRDCGAFCGLERVIFTAAARRDPSLALRVANLARAGLRELHRQRPHGWHSFRRIESLYPMAANNAVLGAAPDHAFARRLVEAMNATPPQRQLVRFALGTHLLQDVVAQAREPDLRVLPPRWFFPLRVSIT